MKEFLEKAITMVLKEYGISSPKVALEHPEVFGHGDYATNVALSYAKVLGLSPRELATKLLADLQAGAFKQPPLAESIAKVEIAGPGFINFHLSRNFFTESLSEMEKQSVSFGKNTKLKGRKVLVEYTDPNPFKVLHIGHLMSNAIGESLSRLFAASGAEVIRANYQGDVGLHVAKTLWGIGHFSEPMPAKTAALSEQVSFIGRAYAFGSERYEVDESAQREIKDLNKKIFEKSDPALNELYDWGRKVSLDHFEEIYAKLGTKFDHYFFESQVAEDGSKSVREFLKRGVFTESDGAIVFKGEEHGLHTRVFINSQGLPTYEAKEIGLNKKKFELFQPDLSVIVTANEQNEYLKVVLRALFLMYPEVAEKTKHVSHGMLRFIDGKMSSRKGNIVSALSLVGEIEEMVQEKIKDRGFDETTSRFVAEKVAIGAIKYSVLKQSPGSDIVYDPEKSISFEGDSGPYLQYAYARARSVIRKAGEMGVRHSSPSSDAPVETLERLLYRFPEVVDRASLELQPHHVTTYLTELAATFNAFYAQRQIIDPADQEGSGQRLRIVSAFATVMKNGLELLAIPVLEQM